MSKVSKKTKDAPLFDGAMLRSSSVIISCPAPAGKVGATFTVCGTFNPTFRCSYRIHLQIYYLNSQSGAVALDAGVVPNGSKYSHSFTLTDLPRQGGNILISAQLENDHGVALSPVEAIAVTFDAGGGDACNCP